MSTLVLRIKRDQPLLLNGVLMQVTERGAVLVLKSRARFVHSHKYMPEADATTPAKRLYYAVQQAYAGGDHLDTAAMLDAVTRFRREATNRMLGDSDAADAMDELEASAKSQDGYQALRQARALVLAEEAQAHV